MESVQTIRLNDDEIEVVEKFLGLIDEITDIIQNTRSMSDVYNYLVDKAELVDGKEYTYTFDGLIQIKDI